MQYMAVHVKCGNTSGHQIVGHAFLWHCGCIFQSA